MKPITYVLALAAMVLSSCETLPPLPSDSAPTAHCLVCRHNRDLGCLDVDKSASTPRYTYQGHTYYFCSDSCREKFAKAPSNYIPR